MLAGADHEQFVLNQNYILHLAGIYGHFRHGNAEDLDTTDRNHPNLSTLRTSMTATIEPLLSAFGAGVNGIQPAEHIKSKVAMFWQTLMPLARPGDVAIDIYRALSFNIWLPNGLILTAEIELDGTFFGRAYYEGNRPTAPPPPAASAEPDTAQSNQCAANTWSRKTALNRREISEGSKS